MVESLGNSHGRSKTTNKSPVSDKKALEQTKLKRTSSEDRVLGAKD